jgi:hypothetical protein
VFESWGKYIRQETLSSRLLAQPPPPEAHLQDHDVDGETLTLGVQRN